MLTAASFNQVRRLTCWLRAQTRQEPTPPHWTNWLNQLRNKRHYFDVLITLITLKTRLHKCRKERTMAHTRPVTMLDVVKEISQLLWPYLFNRRPDAVEQDNTVPV
jgi:hypothetical protein